MFKLWKYDEDKIEKSTLVYYYYSNISEAVLLGV